MKWLVTILLLAPAICGAQQLVNCDTNTPCANGAPAGTGRGDTAALAFSKINANASQLYGRNSSINVIDYGAKCDGSTNDAAAFSSAVAAVNTAHAAGKDVLLRIPAGRCVINSPITQFGLHVPGGVQGDGSFHTVLVIGSGLTGSVFSWDEAWSNTGAGTPTYNFATAWVGPLVVGVSIFANTGSGTQTALQFLDRNDGAFVQDVDIRYFNGSAISIGTTSNVSQAYMRESRFYSVRAFNCGSSSAPAINVSSITTSGGDATNEVRFYGLDVFNSNGIGVAVNNASGFGTIRLISFFGLRVEKSQGSYDLVRIGDTTNNGNLSSISIFGLEENSVPAAAVGLHISGTSNNLYGITVFGADISTGTGVGIQIDAGRHIALRDMKIAASLTPMLVVGATPNLSCCIWLENDFVNTFTATIDPSMASSVYSSGSDGWHIDTAGNGTLNSLLAGGSTFTISGCGAAGSRTGGATAGSFTVGTGASPCTFTVTLPTAPHGWVCNVDDATSNTHLPATTGGDTTHCVVKGSATTSDLILFSAVGY